MKDLQQFKVLVVFIIEFFIVWYFLHLKNDIVKNETKFAASCFRPSISWHLSCRLIILSCFEECHLILFLVVIFIYIDVTVFCQYHHWKEKTELCFQVQDNNIRVIALYSSQHWECNVYIKTEESIFYSSPKNFINFNQTTIIFRTLFQVVCVCFVVLIKLLLNTEKRTDFPLFAYKDY